MRARRTKARAHGGDPEAPATNGGLSPRRVEETLLVVADFRDGSGREWRPGDRAPLQVRNVRLAALANPSWFVMEFETLPVDLEWLRQLDAQFEEHYQAAKRAREAAKDERERALRAELEDQGKNDPALERRYEAQERARKERKQAHRDELERDKLEQDLASSNPLTGFHY